MNFFNQLFKNIGTNNTSSNTAVKEVLLREMVKRSEVFLENYKRWINNEMQVGLINHIWENHLTRIENPNSSVNYFIHRQSRSNGFYFRAENPWISDDYSFLSHFFIERLKNLDYTLSNSTREAIEEAGELKIVEEFYLKPKLKYKRELPYNQLFGNIFIEHRIIGEQTELLKLMVNTYDDANFKPSYHFDDLMLALFRLD